MKDVVYLKLVAVALLLVVGLSLLPAPRLDVPDFTEQTQLKKFASEAELDDFLEAQSGLDYYAMGLAKGFREEAAVAESAAPGAPGSQVLIDAKSSDYSATNIQVAGVDEADFVKNDDKYIYTISGSQVVVTDAYPAESARIISTINLSGSNPQNLYVNGDRLVVFGARDYYRIMPMMEDKELNIGEGFGEVGSSEAGVATKSASAPSESKAAPAESAIWPGPRYYEPTSYIKVYDITDRSNPVLRRDLELNGTYYNSRMIGDYIYAIVNVPAYRGRPLPLFAPNQRAFPEIYYFDIPDYSYQFTNVLSVSVKDDAREIENKVFLLGYSNNIFVSENNIYMVYQKQLDEDYTFYRILDEVWSPLLPSEVVGEIDSIRASTKSDFRKRGEIQLVLNEWAQNNPDKTGDIQVSVQKKMELIYADFERERDKSVIHKISISSGDINYVSKGEVPGMPLNQFSMDEHNGYFRIATTTNQWREEPKNNVYVLDSGMNVVGKIEDLAKGERIFSARFIGDRAYLVTFVRIDPLFVIDLSDPANPAVLGELKIPGVSDYLHPYDENMIIGIGRSTEDIQDRVTFKGLKISLFDVSDVANPVEKAKFEIGDRGTYSEALYDHKAFLFSKEKNLLVLPVTEYQKKTSDEFYGSNVFNGAYAFSVSDSSIELKGKVTHANSTDIWSNNVRRSLYMDDVLYTVSNGFIKANSLVDLSEKAIIKLPQVYYEGPVFIA